MHVRWITASVFVAMSSVAFAQSKAVLGKDDAAYAAALRRFGYPDLAERLLQTIEKSDTLGPEEAISAKALHLDLRLDLALRESDPAKRLESLRAILEEKEALIDQYKGRAVAEEARNSLPDVYRMLGDAVTAAISREKDPDKIAALQKTGSETYTKAEDSLRNRIKQLSESGNVDSPEVQNQLGAARFNLPRTMYFHALLYPKEEFRRKDLLGQAIKGFQEFSLDFGNTLWNYDGLVLEGLCHKELGEIEDAKSAFKDAFDLPEAAGIEKDTKGYYPLSKEMADTVSEAGLQWMNLLLELKDYPAAIALAKQYFDTTPGALETRRGLAILAAMADADLAIDDTKAASDAADKLVAADRGGPWGAKGREIQGRMLGGGNIDPARALAIAKSDADRGDDLIALQHAQMALGALKGRPDEAKLGADAWLFIGSLFARRDLDEEAAQAFDTGAERYPRADQAPELVYQAISRYQALNNKYEKRPYYQKRIDEHVKLLASTYPNSDRAQGSITIEADQAMMDKDYLGAANQYAKVLPTSKVYLEAQAKAGEAYLTYAVTTLKDNPEAKTYLDQAQALLKKVLNDVSTKRAVTLDPGEQARLQNIAVRALTRLSELYLKTDRPAEVLPLLEGAEDKYGANADATNNFWGFRISALQMLGRLDEAITKLDGLIKKDPGSKAIGGASYTIARALDTNGQKLRKDGKVPEADEAQKRAAKYYAIAGRAMLASEDSNIRDVEGIANRLFALGLNVNLVPDLPDRPSTFIGWDPKQTKDTELYQLSADLFESALRRSPNYRSRATLGKIYGFLGKWEKSASTFADLFDTDQLLDAKTKKLNLNLARSKPELVPALFELGVAENKVANADSDNERFRHAQMIFDVMLTSSEDGTWRWWNASYYVIRNKTDMGNYLAARADLNNLERTTNNLGKEFGLEPAFAELKKELQTK